MAVNLGSVFTTDVPARKETAMIAMSTDVFSVFHFENVCPGDALFDNHLLICILVVLECIIDDLDHVIT